MRQTAYALAGTAVALLASAAHAQVAGLPRTPQDIRAQTVAAQTALRAQWAKRVERGSVPATGTEPSLVAGRVLTPSVDVTKAPDVPEVQLTFNTGTVGISGIQVELMSPSGNHALVAGINVPTYPPPSGKLVIKSLLSSPFSNGGLGLYAEPGTWVIAFIQFISQDGQVTFLGASQLASLFKGPASVGVVNPGTPDFTLPVAGHGTILTPTVSLSSAQPYAAVKLSATDNLSGVFTGDVGFSLPGNPSPTTSFSVYGQFDAPLLKGTLILSDLLPSSLTTGAYTINSYYVCDYANNCLYDNTPAGIAAHFDKTTITVTP